jgi:hypothetical protein
MPAFSQQGWVRKPLKYLKLQYFGVAGMIGLSPVRVVLGKGILANPGKAILDGNQKNG